MLKFLTIIYLIIFSLSSIAEEKIDVEALKNICKKDLEYFKKQLEANSAPYANKEDIYFHNWFKTGYDRALELINLISDQDDCLYVMKYYVNGFSQSHISLRSYFTLPDEQYPGILTARINNKHVVIYKHPDIEYLKEIKIGDELLTVNDIAINKYFTDFIEPFYANDNSELTLTAASLYSLIFDGNRFKPVAYKITIKSADDKIHEIKLKYTNLYGGALEAARKLRQPDVSEIFRIDIISNGVWIKIPSFYPTRQEAVYFVGMFSRLKKDLANEDYIIFDLRGNRGGSTSWSIPIIRNLWGDQYLKSLGQNHEYNRDWIKKIRISKENFNEFKKNFNASASKAYVTALKKKEDFFIKKWSIYDDKENLYSNNDNNKPKAKIYVLTDNFCRSTCWSFVSELKQIPNVVHLGKETTIQNIYSYAKKVRSPSELIDFFYPTQIRIQPVHNLNYALIPDHIYEGDMKDDVKVIDWVLSITEKNSN